MDPGDRRVGVGEGPSDAQARGPALTPASVTSYEGAETAPSDWADGIPARGPFPCPGPAQAGPSEFARALFRRSPLGPAVVVGAADAVVPWVWGSEVASEWHWAVPLSRWDPC